jgi:hypothetical protein
MTWRDLPLAAEGANIATAINTGSQRGHGCSVWSWAEIGWS